jgi:hypothetical protein
MENTMLFWLAVASFGYYFVAAPVRHLWTGEVKYNKLAYPEGRILRRDGEPEKFYLRVALELAFTFGGLAIIYWMLFFVDQGR